MSIRTRSSRWRLALALPFVAAVLGAAPPARADEDAMAPYRERFRSGMDRYKAGDVAGAVAWWDPIYREVGPEKGYRVAFDLARAYDKLNDATRAGEQYAAFVQQVEARRARGEALEAIVLGEEIEARQRLALIGAEKGPAAPLPQALPQPLPLPQALPPPPPPPPPQPLPPPPTHLAPTTPPFSPVFLYLSGAAAVGAVVFTSIEYTRALAAKSDFEAARGEAPSKQIAIRDGYDGIRPYAYAGLGASIGLAVVTTALVTWYALGTKEHDVVVAPVFALVRGGGTGGVAARF